MMPLKEVSVFETAKRKRIASVEATLTPDSPSQTPTGKKQSLNLKSRLSPQIWDNLSCIWLTLSALQEFDRRTVKLVKLKPKNPPDLKGYSARKLEIFARRGGPSLCNLRGYAGSSPERTMNSRQFRAEIRTHGSGALGPPQEKTRLATPYDRNYDQYLSDLGVSLYSNAKPDNWQELKARLARRRPSLSVSRFSEEDFQTFKNVNIMAVEAVDVEANVLPIIKGNIAIASCHKRILIGLKPLDSRLANAMPDYYEGSLPADLDLRVRNDLREYIVPSKGWNTPLLPNFFLEINGHKGDPNILRSQVSRDLVYGARGMLEIQSYSNGGRRYDNNTYTIGSLYNGGLGVLRFFTMYPTEPADPTGEPTYQMTDIKSFILTDNVETCREGIEWFRNSREFAKEVRYAAIASANKMAHDRHGGRSSSTSTNHPPISSPTSGVAGLVPGSWLGGPSTSQAPESITTQDIASRSSGSGLGELERPDADSMLGWNMFVSW